VLAQKKPLVPGTPGIDVFGGDIPVPEVKDRVFIAGKGTTYTEDKLKISAAIDGYPEAGLGDIISVFRDYQIRGDVSLETGHIKFDGNVFITGSVTPKFRVSAVNVTANEVVGARIDATGDVNISNGIIDSVIRARGNIQAKFISNSHIETFGDLVVIKEILDSDIMISGTCINKTGNIMFSRISARTGFDICNLGTDMSKPSVIRTGSEDHITSQLERIKRMIHDKQQVFLSLKDEFKKQEKKQIHIHNEITESVSLQEKRIRKMKDAEGKGDIHRAPKLKLEEIENNIDQLFISQEELDREIEMITAKLKEKESEIQKLMDKQKVILHWAEKHPLQSKVKLSGTGLEKETIISPSATLVLTEDIKNKEIREVRSEDQTCHLQIV